MSFIDHFIVSKNLCVVPCDTYNEIENPSDHLPIFVDLVNDGCLLYEQVNVFQNSSTKLWWHKATSQEIDLYKSILDDCLKSINIPWDAITCEILFLYQTYHTDTDFL